MVPLAEEVSPRAEKISLRKRFQFTVSTAVHLQNANAKFYKVV